MFWIENAFAKVWKIESKEKYDDLRISTSEKDNREEGKFINSNWFARTIGHAHQQIANGEFKEGDRVKIVKGKVSNETYEKDGEKKSMLRVTILELGSVDGNSAPAKPAAKDTKAKKTAAKSKAAAEELDDSDLPF